MSTFDTMCDWRDGLKSDTEALLTCLVNLAEWYPQVSEQEAFEALGEIVLSMRKREEEDYERHYRRGESERYIVTPRYPVPVKYCDKSNSAWWQDWLVDCCLQD